MKRKGGGRYKYSIYKNMYKIPIPLTQINRGRPLIAIPLPSGRNLESIQTEVCVRVIIHLFEGLIETDI